VAFALGAAAALGASFTLVRRLERLAGRWHLSEAMLGLMVALAADSPEITSAVAASVRGETTIGAGVVLGSNVFNLAALLGLGAIVAGKIVLHRSVVIFEGVTAMWIAIVSFVVIMTPLPAALGLSMVLVVVLPYVFISAVSTGRLRRVGLSVRVTRWLDRTLGEEELELAEAIQPKSKGSFDVTIAVVSLVIVIGASVVMEQSAQSLGKRLGLSDLIIGGVVLAAVTSLPNAVGAIFLAVRGRGAAVLSEAMNSNMLNVVIGLFLPALFVGFARSSGGSSTIVAFYSGLTLFSLAMAFLGRGLSRLGGIAIVISYVAFVLIAATR
jgi:cation:H+ antiporter